MSQFIIICLLIFLVLWGIGIWMGYVESLKMSPLPKVDVSEKGPAYLEEQKKIVEETETQHKKIMDDYKYQIQKYNDPVKDIPSVKGF